jgi:DNA-binding LacI/PurR family transcriptional regulator
MQGLEEKLADEGYSVTFVTLDDSQLTVGPSAVRVLQEQRADAVVLAGPEFSPRFILATANLGLPTLLVDNALRETPFPAVLADNQGGCRSATDHLIKVHGHQRITLLRGPSGWVSSDERAAGYLEAMEAEGLQPNVVEATDTTIETGREAALQVLDAQPATTAIVAVNDAMAIGAMRAARHLGRSVPDDLAVVGFDNISWATYSDPPLTTVSVPTIEMGRLTARLLLERIKGELVATSRTSVSTRLIIRSSCGCSEMV